MKRGFFFIITIFMVWGLWCVYQANKEPVVVIDDWWEKDFAKAGCDQQEAFAKEKNPYAKPCLIDPQTEVQNFNLQLDALFSSNSLCKGIAFIHCGPDQTGNWKKTCANGHQWSLIIDYVVGDVSQSWGLVGSVLTKGSGEPIDIVRTVCSVVNKKGGSVEQ